MSEERYCVVCGEKDPIVLVTHHIIPRSRTVEKAYRYRIRRKPKIIVSDVDEADNLATLCANCHRRVHYFIDLFPEVHPRTVFQILVRDFTSKNSQEKIEERLQQYEQLERNKTS